MALDTSLESAVSENLAGVRARIATAATKAGRSAGDIQLVAVSKTFGLDSVRAAATAGQVIFGENRVQEAREKIDESKELPLEWHLVGHLQSNKIRKAAELFACIHSLDRVDKLRALDSAAFDLGTRPRVLVQVDLAGEATKHGATHAEVARIFEAAASCRAVQPIGLMVLPPYAEDPSNARPYFRQLREMRDELRATGVSPDAVRELSMGMSHDFEVAIQEGSTIIRVGSAIFGDRYVRNR